MSPRKGWETRSTGRTPHPDRCRTALVPKPVPPADSWWVGLGVQAFYQRLHAQEEPRMWRPVFDAEPTKPVLPSWTHFPVRALDDEAGEA